MELVISPKISDLVNSIRREMESRTAPQSTIIGEETPHLLEQLIMEEILPKLSAKSLLKFRCVSKSWCSLIGSKRFIKTQLKNSIKSPWFAYQWIHYDYYEKEFQKCCLPSLFCNPFPVRISHISELGWNKSDVIIPVGCCNGLVCILLNGERFVLWNPTTNKFNNLPDLYNLIQGKCGEIGTYGFGFDELSDDYKVLGIVNRNNLNGAAPPRCTGVIYSLRSNSWKPIKDSNQVSPINGEGIGMHVSGKLHWKSYKGEIISFDLNSHVPSVVELPTYMKRDLHSLGVIGGCLSAHSFHPSGDLDVWLMRKYGVYESWDKVVTVPFYQNSFRSNLHIPTPVAISPYGEVLLINHPIVMIYNPKFDIFTHPYITIYDDKFASVVRYLGIYIESLVSVAPDAQ